MHPISYYRRKTTREKFNCHSYEAIVNSVERFRVYLVGKYFIIKTDCNSLKLLDSKRDLTPIIGRWFMNLSKYYYSMEYISGSQNLAPDALGRNPVKSSRETETASLPLVFTERDNKYMLTIVDGFSKYNWLCTVKDVSAEEIILYVRYLISHYSKPSRFFIGRGTAFISRLFV